MSPDAYLELADIEASHWWFCGRRSILARIIERLRLPPTARILEVGAGTGGNLEMLSSFGHVSAVEMDETARSMATAKTNGRFEIRAGSFPSSIPFEGERFDLICLFDVLEHIDADVETLAAIRSLLAENGRVLVTVPAHAWMWSAHDEFMHHKRRYSAAGLRETATAAGYTVQTLSFFNTLLFPAAAIARLKDRWLGRSPAPAAAVPPKPMNRVLTGIFSLERFLLPTMRLPFGVSLLCILHADR